MARSSNKFIPMYFDDLRVYFKVLTEQKKLKPRKVARRKTINYWNSLNLVSVHQGRYWQKLNILEYHQGLKYGQLSKTKKPFFFRSKKKR